MLDLLGAIAGTFSVVADTSGAVIGTSAYVVGTSIVYSVVTLIIPMQPPCLYEPLII